LSTTEQYRSLAAVGQDHLDRLPEWLADLGDEAPVRLAEDAGALGSCNLILGASNSPDAVITAESLGRGPGVICDVSVPADVHPAVRDLPQWHVIQGGIVELPADPEFSVRGVPLEPGRSFACMGETLLMGLSGHDRNFSYGRIDVEQVEQALALADRHGFRLGRARVEASY
jgi:predicted amino acid dehydrogenase